MNEPAAGRHRIGSSLGASGLGAALLVANRLEPVGSTAESTHP